MINILNSKLVTMWEYQIIYIVAKGFTPNWSEEVFLIKKVKNTAPFICVIEYLNVKEIIRTFYKKDKATEFRIDKEEKW